MEKLARLAMLALLILLLAWHLWLAPSTAAPAWAMAAFFSLPLLPGLLLALAGHRRAGFWGAMAALLYFNHGVMVAWSDPDVRWLGLLEALASTVIVVAASWDGLKARRAARRKPPAV